MNFIDLRSDTVTKPTSEMKEAMMKAPVGDDVFYEDPTINLLQEQAARLFGMEAGLYCPSGTMTNQIAIKVHTQPGQEVICDRTAHIYNFEGGGIAFNSGCSVRTVNGKNGIFTSEDITANINPPNDHFSQTTLVSVENTSNKGGGHYYTLPQLKAIGETCREHGLKYHLDGARVFNALVETGDNPAELGKLFDSISICLSKGLGAPVGSVLLGSKDFIKKAHAVRKVLGGGMRQAGIIAAAGIYALDSHIERLKEDHRRAKELETLLQELDYVEDIVPVKTNIVVFRLKETMPSEKFLQKLTANHIKAVPFGPQTIRFVTHLDFDDEMLEKVKEALKQIH